MSLNAWQDQALALRDKGLTNTQIARRLGKARTTVREFLERSPHLVQQARETHSVHAAIERIVSGLST